MHRVLRWLVLVFVLLFGAHHDVAIEVVETVEIAEAETDAKDESLLVVKPETPPNVREIAAPAVRVLASTTDPDTLFRPPRG